MRQFGTTARGSLAPARYCPIDQSDTDGEVAMSAEPDDVTPFHMAWITADEELDDTVQIVVYDPIEYRIPVFEADTGLPLKADPGTVAARATELLQIDGGFIVHTMEPHGSGFAAVVEASPA
jgi:hypothetical protein